MAVRQGDVTNVCCPYLVYERHLHKGSSSSWWGGEGEKTPLACSQERVAFDRLHSSTLHKPFVRLLRCLFFKKSVIQGRTCVPVGCWLVWGRGREGPRAGPGLTPAAPGPGAGLVATAEARWGHLGLPHVTGALRSMSGGVPALGVGVGGVAGLGVEPGAGRVLCSGGAWPGLQPAEGSEQKR